MLLPGQQVQAAAVTRLHADRAISTQHLAWGGSNSWASSAKRSAGGQGPAARAGHSGILLPLLPGEGVWGRTGQGSPFTGSPPRPPSSSTCAPPHPWTVGQAGSLQPKPLALGIKSTWAKGGGWGLWLCPCRLCSLGTRRGQVKLGASLTLTVPVGALG